MINLTKTTEGMAMGVVLQQPLGTITIGDATYSIDRPRLATHVLISEAISRLPYVKGSDDIETQITEALRVAKDSGRIIAEIAAILILGAKGLTGERIVEKKRFFGLVKTRKTLVVNLKEELADKLFLELSPLDCRDLIIGSLGNQQLPVFFGVITSLYEVNLLKPTSEVQTTAFGL